MPVLRDSRQTKVVTLTALEGGEVTVYQSVLAGDIDRIYKENGTGGETNILLMLSIIIKEWNLTDEEGTVLPITRENVAKLDARDLNTIVGATDFGNDFLAKGTASSDTSA